MEEREKLVREKILEEEFIDRMHLSGIKMKVLEMLTKEKMFDPADIEIDPEFRLTLGDSEFVASIDFIVNCHSVSFMVMRCATAIESWERYIVSFARVIKDYQIPYAVVTDGDKARIIDVLKGTLAGESINRIFNKEEVLEKIKDFKKVPCPSNRLEREKRIVYAFEGIKCPTQEDPGD